MKFLVSALLLSTLTQCFNKSEPQSHVVKPGAQVLVENHLSELEGKRIGLVMNPTARIRSAHVLDILLNLDVNVTALYAPEHGFRGNYGDGEIITGGIDKASGLPVFSLYGKVKKPTKEMLESVDILLFDMQDVGARFYTYNSTMKLILEAAAENDKEVWILDRPNPVGGDYVAGWILENEYQSFVGSYPIPVAHGLTLGELALMAVGEGWLATEKKPKLKIITMEGWKRHMRWPETGLTWIPPSPNLPEFENAFVYLGTCFIEGLNISEGRGTSAPFLLIGSPDYNPDMIDIRRISEKYQIQIDTTSFKPVSIPGKSLHPKFEDQKVKGVELNILPGFEDPVSFGIELTKHFMEHTVGVTYREHFFLLSGTKKILEKSAPFDWGKDFGEFKEARKQYLIYD